jgi:hypothetical protein
VDVEEVIEKEWAGRKVGVAFIWCDRAQMS